MKGTTRKSWPLMNEQELHEFGIQALLRELPKESFEIEGTNCELGSDPQVVGTRWGLPAFIVVRTACYPNKGELNDHEVQLMFQYSHSTGRLPCFASVGLQCTAYPDRSDVECVDDMCLPIYHGGFFVAYDGLLVLQDADRVVLLGEAAKAFRGHRH